MLIASAHPRVADACHDPAPLCRASGIIVSKSIVQILFMERRFWTKDLDMPEVRERAGHQPMVVFRQTFVIAEHVPRGIGSTGKYQEVSQRRRTRLPEAPTRYLDVETKKGLPVPTGMISC
jgi:hypothetical protein